MMLSCINKYVNELCFSCCSEFDLYPKFPSEAGNCWNNPRMNSQLILTLMLIVIIVTSVSVNNAGHTHALRDCGSHPLAPKQ